MEGYWKEMYGTQSEDFIKGVIAGVSTYAVWRDGSQYVGSVIQVPLKEVVEEIREQLGGNP